MNNKESSVCITRCINVRVSNISERRKKKIKTKKNPYPSIEACVIHASINSSSTLKF